MIDPLRLSFRVACPPDHAFEVWTARINLWWPRSHTVTAGDGLQVVLEGRVGGRLYERTRSGQEVDWGEVVVWDPPQRFVYLWHIRWDRAEATEVEVTFTGDDTGTRVDIEHRGWERLGEPGSAMRDANRAGWDGLLPHFISVCAQEA